MNAFTTLTMEQNKQMIQEKEHLETKQCFHTCITKINI